MPNNRALHPRRAGVGDALALMIPLPESDGEEKAEKQIIHRLELRDRVRKL